MIPDSIIEQIGPVIESVGADMGRRYSKYGADQADMSQEGWVWIYLHPGKVNEWFDPDLYSAKDGERLLARTLRNELHDFGEELKAQHLGYSRDDLVHYSRGMVRALLPSMFDPEAWLHPETPSSDTERRQKSVPAEGGNWVATLADVSQGFDKLDEEDRDLLAAFHRDSWSNKMLAEEAGVTEQTMSYRHDQAIKRLVNLLGGPAPRAEHDADCNHEHRDPYQGRRAVTNATARAIQQGNYDE